MLATPSDPSDQLQEPDATEQPLRSESLVGRDEAEPPVHDLAQEPPVVESSEPVPFSPPGGSRLVRLPPGHLFRDVLMLAMLLFVLFGSVGLVVLRSNDAQADQVRIALGVITRTPTPTFTLTPSLTPTLTRTPTPTLTPTTTPTLTPSVTPSATPTFTPSPTPTPSWITKRYLPLPLDEKWIEVNLTEQSLTAYEGTTVVLTSTISSGKGPTPTRLGKFRIQRKFESQLMIGPGYYLPNVPHVMYFYANFALHGAYWHDKWGTPTSHGCVNINLEDAEWLYEWADPKVPPGAMSVEATKENPGTWVLIHR